MGPIQIKISDTSLLYGLPSRATEGAAGYDLKADIPAPLLLLPDTTVRIPTGVSIFIEDRSVAACIFPRSGLANSFSLTLQNAVGLIDSDYQGELQVLLRNEGLDPYEVRPGDRIAQLVFMPVIHPMMAIVQDFTVSPRGSKGFGSTGVNSRLLTEGLAPTTPEGTATPFQMQGNDLPIESGIPFDITLKYEPTGFESLEAAYGE